MATLEEVLTKPAKELANWNFPLATVLQEYYALLREQEEVNFSNAALVLQNSAAVYVRRVDYLLHETNILNESFAKQDAEDTARKESKKSAKLAQIDFGDFESTDFAKFVGKQNNIKERTGTKNSVKLLGERFPQLENARSSLAIDVYDIHGEVVGKKYDFRCNEYLTASGMLVDQLTPEDFADECTKRSTNVSTELQASSVDLVTSLQLTPPLAEMDSGIDVQDHNDCEDSCVVHDQDTGLLDTSFASSFDSGLGSSIQSSNRRPDSSLTNYEDSNSERLESRPGSRLSTIDENNSLVESAPLPLPVAVPQDRRSKRLKNAIDAAANLNPKQWEPIPTSRTEFKLPCPVSLLKGRKRPFKRKPAMETQSKRPREKLATIESGVTGEKKTIYSPTRQLFHPFKKEELEDFQSCFEEGFKNRAILDALSYEPVTDKSMDLLGFKSIQDIRKRDRGSILSTDSGIGESLTTDTCFEEPLEKRSRLDVTNYEAVTNVSMDLLGIATSTPNSDRVIRGVIAGSTDETENGEPADSFVNDFPMPYTPESSDSSDDVPTSTLPPTYQSRIEQSVRDIYLSADVRTAQEEAVARWHEFMKPKLREVERRQQRRPFDVKQYSALVIEKMKAKSDGKIEFEEVVDRHEPAEVARYFLASLQLANKYNLRIDTSNTAEGNNITLVLLDQDR